MILKCSPAALPRLSHHNPDGAGLSSAPHSPSASYLPCMNTACIFCFHRESQPRIRQLGCCCCCLETHISRVRQPKHPVKRAGIPLGREPAVVPRLARCERPEGGGEGGVDVRRLVWTNGGSTCCRERDRRTEDFVLVCQNGQPVAPLGIYWNS